MIKKIVMRNVASYGDSPVEINLENKKVCLFYGLNGTGKSTITNYLYDLQKDVHDNKFSQCNVSFDDNTQDYEILVYNEKFVEDNFFESTSQKGVFSVGKPNVDAEKAIQKAESDRNQLQNELEPMIEQENDKEEKKRKLESEIKNRVFDEKRNHENRELDFCLAGAKKTDSFWNKLIAVTPNPNSICIDELINAAKLIKNPPAPKSLLKKIDVEKNEIETNTIWNEIIVGTGDSYLKELITAMNNSSWVKQGFTTYLPISKNKCPFCQQSLSSDFSTEITKLFGKTYEAKCARINLYQKEYSEFKTIIENALKEIEDTSDKFSASKEKLLSLLQVNYQNICKKENNPELKLNLNQTKELISVINGVIEEINIGIKEFNSKLENPDNERIRINTLFWQYVEQTYHNEIVTFNANNKELSDEILKINNHITQKNERIKNLETTIQLENEKIVSLGNTITKIRNVISILGLTGFDIVESTEMKGRLCLIREHSDIKENIYKTLSEGEKTLIAFLYFLELCKGTTDKKKLTDCSKRIIVIDDPISSLSQNYVYDIASLISCEFTEEKQNDRNIERKLLVEQLVIFTHNLFFFHELSKKQKLNVKLNTKNISPCLYRIRKNLHTDVVKMDENEVLNDYESFWVLYKECLEGTVPIQIIPNVMRNILEYFFAFTKQYEKLSNALEDISHDDIKFKPLHRYIDRGSHSDIINISEFKDIDIQHYQRSFYLIFEKTGYIDHYNKMMGKINTPQQGAQTK